MDVFDKIEEFEKIASSEISNKIDLFHNIMFDKEIFEKILFSKSPDISIESTMKDVINDIKSDNSITSLIISNFKRRLNAKDTPSLPNKKPQNYLSKEHGSNLSISPFANYFDQKSIDITKVNQQFYHKNSEVGLYRSSICDMLLNQLRRKFYIAYHDSFSTTSNNNTYQMSNEGIAIGVGVGVASDDSSSYSNNESNGNSYKRKLQSIRINDHVNRMYPRQKHKEDVMNERLIQEKMIEYYFTGRMTKQVDMVDIMQSYHVLPKKQLKMSLDVQMDLTNLLVNGYNTSKALKCIRSKRSSNNSTMNNNASKRDEVINANNLSGSCGKTAKNLFIETKSKLYARLNRNRDDLRLVPGRWKRMVNPLRSSTQAYNNNNNNIV